MSRLARPNGDDHPEAAAKHLSDSTELLKVGRHDGAGYLAGYVVECVLKTVLLAESGTAEMTHDLQGLSVRVLKAVPASGSLTGRYLTPTTLTTDIAGISSGWKETLRYRPGGSVSAADAAAWSSEAQRLFRTVIEPLRLDGVI